MNDEKVSYVVRLKNGMYFANIEKEIYTANPFEAEKLDWFTLQIKLLGLWNDGFDVVVSKLQPMKVSIDANFDVGGM